MCCCVCQRKNFCPLRALLAIVAWLTVCSVGVFAADQAQLPHIVVILADDMGSGDPGCYNAESKIPTPNLDRLAKEGMRFTDAHTPSSVCTPTRYGLMTGRYCWRSKLKRGVLNGYSPLLIEPKRMTVPSLLKAHGYATNCVGKWHLGLGNAGTTDYAKQLSPGPNDVGFDYFFGIPASLDMTPYVFVENDEVVARPTESVAGSKMRRDGGGGFWRGGPIAPDFKHVDVLPKLTEKAVAVIDKHAQLSPEKPMFLYMPLNSPHTPWMPTEAWRGKSKAGFYGDFAAQTDDAVGQVLAALDRNKMAANTLFIFTSDNGAHWLPSDIEKYGHRANASLRGQKSDIHEGGHRVPFLARWPGKTPSGSTSNETICLVDLLATCADIVGEKVPDDAGEDSYSLLPELAQQEYLRPLREATVHHSGNGKFAIRQGPWKLIIGLGSGGFTPPADRKPKDGEPIGQLFNLEQDPSETKNLYLDEPEMVERLSALLKRYQEQGFSRKR